MYEVGDIVYVDLPNDKEYKKAEILKKIYNPKIGTVDRYIVCILEPCHTRTWGCGINVPNNKGRVVLEVDIRGKVTNMAKFKENDIVLIKDPLSKHFNVSGIVVDYLTKVENPEEHLVVVDFGDSTERIKESYLELIGVKVNKDGEDINVIASTKLTDPAVDYEALSKDPVYYEFVDIGKALNKLKILEHTTPSISNTEKVLYIIDRKYAGVRPYLIIKQEKNPEGFIDEILCKNPEGVCETILLTKPKYEIYTNLEEALKRLNG